VAWGRSMRPHAPQHGESTGNTERREDERRWLYDQAKKTPHD